MTDTITPKVTYEVYNIEFQTLEEAKKRMFTSMLAKSMSESRQAHVVAAWKSAGDTE